MRMSVSRVQLVLAPLIVVLGLMWMQTGTAQAVPASENWSGGTAGGPWPAQWSSQVVSGTLPVYTTSTVAFNGTDQTGKAVRGGSGGVGLQYLNGANATIVDSDQVMKIAITSNTIRGGFIARRADGSPTTYYGCEVGNGTAEGVRLFKTVAGTTTQLALAAASPPGGVPYMASVNTWYKIRFKVTQSGGGTNLQAKLWLASTAEPANWTVEVSGNTEAALQDVSGRVGIYTIGGSSPSKFVYYDDYGGPDFSPVRLWDDPASWSTGVVPTSITNAVIDGTEPMVLNVDAAVASLLIEPGATLQFDPDVTHTLCSTGNVEVQGTLEMKPATAEQEHTLKITGANENGFVGGGMDVLTTDPGVWVMGSGQLDVVGTAKTAWLRAGVALAAGATSVTLDATPSGWRVGDTIVIAPTSAPSATSHNEFDERTITAISGTTVTLNSGLTYAHPAIAVTGTKTMTAEVLNLTRNVRIEGMPPSFEYPNATQNNSAGRSHLMICNSTATVQNIQNVALRYMGPRKYNPTDSVSASVKGRYSMHFHHGHHNNAGTVVQGVVARDGGGHAFVAHMTDGITFRRCISYNTNDDAFWWDPRTSTSEEATADATTNETLYDYCVAAKVKSGGPTRIRVILTGYNLGIGEGNTVNQCVAVGVQGVGTASGYMWPELANHTNNNWGFTDNVSHNNMLNGAYIWQNDANPHVLDRFVSYHNAKHGIEHGAYRNSYTWREAAIYENGGGVGGTGSTEFMLHNSSSISGFSGRLLLSDFEVDSNGKCAHILQILQPKLPGFTEALLLGWKVKGSTAEVVSLNQNAGGGVTATGKYDLVNWTIDGSRELEPSDFKMVRLEVNANAASVVRVQRTDGTAYKITTTGNGTVFAVTPIPTFYPY